MSSGGSLLSPSSWKHVTSKLLTLACWRPRVKQPSRSIRSTWSGRASPVHITILYRLGWGSPGGSPGPSPGGPDDGRGESEPYLYTSLFCTGAAEALQGAHQGHHQVDLMMALVSLSLACIHHYFVQVRLRLTRASSGPPGDAPVSWASPVHITCHHQVYLILLNCLSSDLWLPAALLQWLHVNCPTSHYTF